jgi:hypothetical protein
VSFVDFEGVEHAVTVMPDSLFEAAVLRIASFRSAELTGANPRTGLRLSVAVRPPAVEHSIEVNKVLAWLKSIGKSPREQALKVRLREPVGLEPP